MVTNCPDCTRNGGAYNLRCLPCATYGHSRADLITAAKAYRNGPADGR